MKNVIMVFFLVTSGYGFSQQASRTYLELNGGAALVEEFTFPGLSFLVGRQYFVSEKVFIEFQGGLAFPTIVTAKSGIGISLKHIGVSAGLRVFPTLAYFQLHLPFKNSQLNVSAETALFSEWFSIAQHIFTIGYQWNIGKSRIN